MAQSNHAKSPQRPDNTGAARQQGQQDSQGKKDDKSDDAKRAGSSFGRGKSGGKK